MNMFYYLDKHREDMIAKNPEKVWELFTGNTLIPLDRLQLIGQKIYRRVKILII